MRRRRADPSFGPMTSADAVRSWWVPVTVGAVSVLLGLLVIAYPDVSLLALALITGINLILLSALLLTQALTDDETTDKTLRVVVGVLGIVAGIIVVRRPGETLLVLVLAIGLWLVLDGIAHLMRAAFGASGHRPLHLLTGLLQIGFGIVLLAVPDVSLGTLAVLAGIAFVLRGGLLIAVGFGLRGDSAEPLGSPPAATPRPTA
jgi:uncharacterized membrane protein HdeD (DUF308 family)